MYFTFGGELCMAIASCPASLVWADQYSQHLRVNLNNHLRPHMTNDDGMIEHFLTAGEKVLHFGRILWIACWTSCLLQILETPSFMRLE